MQQNKSTYRLLNLPELPTSDDHNASLYQAKKLPTSQMITDGFGKRWCVTPTSRASAQTLTDTERQLPDVDSDSFSKGSVKIQMLMTCGNLSNQPHQRRSDSIAHNDQRRSDSIAHTAILASGCWGNRVQLTVSQGCPNYTQVRNIMQLL